MGAEMTRTIFLDFDGVVITAATRFRSMDPECVCRLDALCREAGAGVVITSTWRHIGLGRCRAMLREAGFHGRVLGATPVLWAHPRGDEIAAWQLKHGPTDYIILDDDRDMGDLLPRLVRTATPVGLQDADVSRALALLGGVAPEPAQGAQEGPGGAGED